MKLNLQLVVVVLNAQTKFHVNLLKFTLQGGRIETNCWIAHILGILLINGYDFSYFEQQQFAV